MFGIRTVVLGPDLLVLRGPALHLARTEAVIIHCTDTACADIGRPGCDLAPRAPRLAIAISALNAPLAAVARFCAPKAG